MPSRNPQSLTSEVDSVLGPAPAEYGQPEVVVLRFRRHGRRLVLPVLVLVAVAAAGGYWIGTFAEGWMNALAACGAILLALLLGVFPLLRWLTWRTTVTTRRVIQRQGVFSRHRSEVSFVRTREVRTRRTLVQRLFGSGDIDLFIGAERTTIPDVPGVSAAADALQELVERNFAHATRVERLFTDRAEAPGLPL